MSKYFYAFPKIEYNKRLITNISRRVVLPKELADDPYLFLPYTVQHDDKAETVAYHYYGSVEYTWLVYFANGIIDPYTDWIMDGNTFANYLMKKYEDQAGTKGYDVIRWTMNNEIDDNILYYCNVEDDTLKISKDTYDLDDSLEAGQWRPRRIYEEEYSQNENKRVIRLINKDYKDVLKKSLESAL